MLGILIEVMVTQRWESLALRYASIRARNLLEFAAPG